MCFRGGDNDATTSTDINEPLSCRQVTLCVSLHEAKCHAYHSLTKLTLSKQDFSVIIILDFSVCEKCIWIYKLKFKHLIRLLIHLFIKRIALKYFAFILSEF